jgi:L-malate glycosyltransferase
MTKLRICFIGPMLGQNPGWVPNPMEILAPHLEARGYACTLTSRIVNRYHRLVDIVQTIVRQHNEFDLFCLQVYSGPSFVVEDIVSRLGQLFRIPIVMFLHGGAIPDFMARYPNWSLHVFRRATIILTPSAYLAQALRPYGFNARVIPNLLNLDKYPYRHRPVVQPALLWMRTFYEYYRPELAVEVLTHLLPDFPEATLTMAGQDKGLLAATREMVNSLGLEKQVRFPGFLDVASKRREFSQHDIFLNTTQIDNMPICLLEAGAFGTPIVSTNVGGVPFLVQDEQTALLAPPDDDVALSNAVKRLLREPGLAGRLSSGGRSLAESCGTEQVLPLWERVFAEILQRG